MSVPNRLPRPEPPQAPDRPKNALNHLGEGIAQVVGMPFMVVDQLNTGFAKATQAIAQVLPAMPAATMGSIVMGVPHAHALHPPSGPPPVPPTPLPPMGAITAGICVQVLINGRPAARAGDIIVNPTCCGIPPLGEIKTGSSNVFIGGARAARATDISMHCTMPTGVGDRGASMAMRKALNVGAKVMQGLQRAGQAAQALSIAGDAIASAEAFQAEDKAMGAALAQSAAAQAAQIAADVASMALAAAMGKDPCLPPTGTPGAVTTLTSPNVLIGGFPMPSWTDIAKGLLKAVKGLRRRAGKKTPIIDGLLAGPCHC